MTNTVPMCAVVHFEMPYKDRERAARFYAAAFGWTHQMLGPEMGDYMLVSTAPPGARPPVPPDAALGSINGGLFPFKPDWPMQHPSVVISVDDIRAAMQRVKAAGGEVMGEPMAIPGVGEYVVFRDTEGNHNSMMQPDMAPPAFEAELTPEAPEELMAEMAAYHDELMRAGVLLDGSGLHPSRTGWRLHYGPEGKRIVDGPFAQAKELIAGYTLIQVRNREEALEWSRRFPNPAGRGKEAVIELRQLIELDEFPPGPALDKFKQMEAEQKA